MVIQCPQSLPLHAIMKHCRTKSARIDHHNTLRNLCTLCTRFFAENLNLSQVMDSGPQMYTIYYYNEEINPVLIHWWRVCRSLFLCWATVCFTTLLSYSQSNHIAEINPVLLHSWAIPSFNTLLSYTQSQHILEVYPILIFCWVIPKFLVLMSCS